METSFIKLVQVGNMSQQENSLAKVSYQLTCSHPDVERVWQIGGDTRIYEQDEPKFRTITCLLMKDGTRKEFYDDKKDYDRAEKYLQSINQNLKLKEGK